MSSPLTDENLVPSSTRSPEGESNEDFEIFPDIALAYISQILMDDDDKVDDFHDNSVLETAKKSFYEILNKKFPQPESNCSSRSPDSISHYENLSSGGGSSSNTNSGVIVDAWLCNNIGEGPADGIGLADLLEGMPTWNFQKGVEEARKFLPDNEKFAIDLESNGLSLPLQLRENSKFETECSYSIFESRGHRSRDIDNLDLEEGRSVKHTAVSCEEETTRSQELDEALLFYGETVPKTISDIREAFQEAVSKSSKNGKGHRRKQSNREVVDVWTLLIQCAQMVAANDQRSTNELLKLIRQHSSPFGDGSQRLSHYFANGIEARLAGTGSEIYNSYRATRSVGKNSGLSRFVKLR